MAYHSFGTGTDLLGQQNFDSDGSYLTTKFVVFLTIPLFPIKTLRVRELASQSGLQSLSRQRTETTILDVMSTYPVNWGQTLRVYATALVFVATFYAAFAVCFYARVSALAASPIILSAVLVPQFTIGYSRIRASRRAIRAGARAQPQKR